MHGTPAKVLAWGIATAVTAGALILFVPAVADWASVGATEEGQVIRVALEFGIRIVREIAAPLGAALIAAALVMGFINAGSSRAG